MGSEVREAPYQIPSGALFGVNLFGDKPSDLTSELERGSNDDGKGLPIDLVATLRGDLDGVCNTIGHQSHLSDHQLHLDVHLVQS